MVMSYCWGSCLNVRNVTANFKLVSINEIAVKETIHFTRLFNVLCALRDVSIHVSMYLCSV